MKDCVSQLKPTRIHNDLNVIHEINLSMIDGKLASSISLATNSMQCCPFCATSKASELQRSGFTGIFSTRSNYFPIINFTYVDRNYGILPASILGANYQKLQARTRKEKEAVQKWKSEIQRAFRHRIRLL